jgi:hypothetical protein
MLTIEQSLHNETRLAKALSAKLGWEVYGLNIHKYGDRYEIKWKSENSTIWMFILNRVPERHDGIGNTYQDYYKLQCDKAVWYLRRDEIMDLNTFVFNIKGVIDEFIKLSK